MTTFVDASALLAIVAHEPDALALAECLDAEPRRLCSAIAALETVAALCHSHMWDVATARARVQLFLDALSLQFATIGEREFEVAAEAYARFGKGRHPAALNMGDCFAYACARTNHAKLLFKGNDFARTDIEPATA
jgi:ribonuclease VapC